MSVLPFCCFESQEAAEVSISIETSQSLSSWLLFCEEYLAQPPAWRVPKIRGTFCGVGSPILGNYHISFFACLSVLFWVGVHAGSMGVSEQKKSGSVFSRKEIFDMV